MYLYCVILQNFMEFMMITILQRPSFDFHLACSFPKGLICTYNEGPNAVNVLTNSDLI